MLTRSLPPPLQVRKEQTRQNQDSAVLAMHDAILKGDAVEKAKNDTLKVGQRGTA